MIHCDICRLTLSPPLGLRCAGSWGGAGAGRFALAECQLARASDFGSNDRTTFARTHLGRLLHAGDAALGYDVANANLADQELDKYIASGKVGTKY